MTRFSLKIALSCAIVCAQTIAASPQAEVIAAGLNNPRGLAFGPEGALYVAEAGSGGAGPCAAAPEGIACIGATGSITKIDLKKGTQERIVTGLPSTALAGGRNAIGPHHISFQGLGNGYFTVGMGGNPNTRRQQFGALGAGLDRLYRLLPNGNFEDVTDVAAYEAANDPNQDGLDSNAYGLLVLPGRQVFTDAGGNDLVEIDAAGRMRTLATFADRTVSAFGTVFQMDAVPTCVAEGPDGALYVGQLTGIPFPVGGANVYRVPSAGGTPEVFASGFSGIIDLTFGHDGRLYVLQIANNVLLGFILNQWTGALYQVAPDGTRTELAPGELFAPGGIAFGPDGALYVTNKSILSGEGEVLRIRP